MSRRPAVAVAVLLALAALVGCSRFSKEGVLLRNAFKQPIESAQVSLRITADGAGPGARLTLTGPMRRNGANRLESFDWTVRGALGPKAFSVRVISTGTNVFVRHEGRQYEVGEAAVAELNRQQRRSGDKLDDPDDLLRFGVDPAAWFPKAKESGDATVDGVRTTEVRGRLDISRFLRDLAKLMRNPKLGGGAGAGLTERDIAKLDRQVTDPTFSVFVGQEDTKVRRITGALRFRTPGTPAGPPRGRLAFVLDLKAVDRPVVIPTPRGGRPIGELLTKLGLSGGAVKTPARAAAGPA